MVPEPFGVGIGETARNLVVLDVPRGFGDDEAIEQVRSRIAAALFLVEADGELKVGRCFLVKNSVKALRPDLREGTVMSEAHEEL